MSRLIALGARLAVVAVLGALLGAVVQSLSSPKPATAPPLPPTVRVQAALHGPQLRATLALRAMQTVRRSYDVASAERSRLLGLGASSVVVAFFDSGDAAEGFFGIEAIRAAPASAAARQFHDHARYTGPDYAWMAGASWQTYDAAREAYTCITAAAATSAPMAICEFRDGDVQGTATGIGMSLSRVLALTSDARLQMEWSA